MFIYQLKSLFYPGASLINTSTVEHTTHICVCCLIAIMCFVLNNWCGYLTVTGSNILLLCRGSLPRIPPLTTRNIAIRCALLEAVLHEPHLKHYQQQFISPCPYQLLVVGLSVAVLHVEPLLIILWIISNGSGDESLPIIQLSATVQNRDMALIMGCTINNGLLWQPLLIRLFYSVPYSKLLSRNSYFDQRFIVGGLAHGAAPSLHCCS
jgi:hypothetical protein